MRILIAEDDPVIALGLSERVRRLGHEPIGPAADGAEAIELARAELPELYVFDIDMPGVDGLAAARALADEGLGRPVVVVTGVEDPGLVARSVETGVDAYLCKPVGDRELDAAIRLAAARHHERDSLARDAARARQELAERKLIERAKGMLMDALGLSEAEAFGRLQRFARDHNLRLAEVARRVVEQRTLLERLD